MPAALVPPCLEPAPCELVCQASCNWWQARWQDIVKERVRKRLRGGLGRGSGSCDDLKGKSQVFVYLISHAEDQTTVMAPLFL